MGGVDHFRSTLEQNFPAFDHGIGPVSKDGKARWKTKRGPIHGEVSNKRVTRLE